MKPYISNLQKEPNITHIHTGIIPEEQTFIGEKKTLDKEAICVFAATGFFLDQDTFFKEQKVLRPATNYKIDQNTHNVISETPYFKWHYTPKERSFDSIVDEFAQLFETIIKEQVNSKQVILPLSGGLDSRTQAIALYHIKASVNSYSYKFENGHNETYYGKKIASYCGFPFQALTVKNGYLWDVIDNLANLTNCYSEFTHPRQMAFIDDYAKMGSIFSLGHWGDVLFDDMHVEDDMPFDDQVRFLMQKIIKKGGLSLANSLWESWHLPNSFESYLHQRISSLLEAINIPENANSQIRAFKSLYWAPRWTSINLSVFKSQRPIALPYYDNRMCEFICTIPERYLAGRQIQIAYIKKRMPKLARLTWQAQRPFNLYTYKHNHFPLNIPYRVLNKLKQMVSTKSFVQRNWELQFIGKENSKHLEKRLFKDLDLTKLVDRDIVKKHYELFQNKDQVFYSHSISILLTLSLFAKKELNKL